MIAGLKSMLSKTPLAAFCYRIVTECRGIIKSNPQVRCFQPANRFRRVRAKPSFTDAPSDDFFGSLVKFMAGSSNVDPDLITKRYPDWFRI